MKHTQKKRKLKIPTNEIMKKKAKSATRMYELKAIAMKKGRKKSTHDSFQQFYNLC